MSDSSDKGAGARRVWRVAQAVAWAIGAGVTSIVLMVEFERGALDPLLGSAFSLTCVCLCCFAYEALFDP